MGSSAHFSGSTRARCCKTNATVNSKLTVSTIYMKMKMKCLPMLFLMLAVISTVSEARRRKPGGVCGLTCYRWKKCKGVLATLTSSSGATRPGQRGTTGQLIFSKCVDPPEKCKCQLEEPKPTGPPKPRIPKTVLEYVDSDAMDWLTNLVDID